MIVPQANQTSGTTKDTQAKNDLHRNLPSLWHLQTSQHEERGDCAGPVHDGENDRAGITDDDPTVLDTAMAKFLIPKRRKGRAADEHDDQAHCCVYAQQSHVPPDDVGIMPG